MLQDLFRKLFGTPPPTPKQGQSSQNSRKPSATLAPPPPVRVDTPTPPVSPAKNVDAEVVELPAHTARNAKSKTQRPSRTKRLPLDLDLGIDIGTSCTKVVVGDREANRQWAIQLRSDKDPLKAHLLPTHVYFNQGDYSLDPAPGAELRRNLKMRLMESLARGGSVDGEAMCDITAYAALVLRRVLHVTEAELQQRQPNREVVWHVNVGLPSRGGSADIFGPTYRRIIQAAAAVAVGTQSIDRLALECHLNQVVVESWLSADRLNAFPEAGAQLASLVLSPHRPSGCLLVVDVGAGTLDVSALRIGGDKTTARCTIHCCNVAPLGVHYLHLARLGAWTDAGVDITALQHIPEDDGATRLSPSRTKSPSPAFVEQCKSAILPTVTRYRQKLRAAHQSPSFRPWTDGLHYILSGGGHRDAFYQHLLQHELDRWLATVASEWDPTAVPPRRAGLKLRQFPLPPNFLPKKLHPHFDRFSVAHGLSLGPDGLMELKDIST